ncbi:MAG: prepilin peptidase [Terracidiphilus sp.]|jgi:leader peptidase (prepilin peptidase)/N-methyltransferase
MIRVLGTLFAGLLGLAFGSFLNVCLSRWPEGESIVHPRSHCMSCGRTLAWWENVPLVSWMALRGRCRTCGAPISWRYPLVELAVAATWSFIAWRFLAWAMDLPGTAFSFEFGRTVGRMIFCWLLIALAAFDAEDLWLPDRLTLPGIAIGFLYSLIPLPLGSTFALVSFGSNVHVRAAIASLVSILAAAGLILLIRWIYWLVRRREGVGLGDAKLMAMLAAWLGLQGALLSFGLGVVLGAITALVLLVLPSTRDKNQSWAQIKLPLGAFLCVGGIVSSLWGEQMIHAYLRWAGF